VTFKDASAYRIAFGKHKFKTLDHVASTDEGLLYLDWLRGEREKRIGGFADDPAFDTALRTYLDDPTIAKQLAELLEERSR
jgi:hypothetical protein